MSASRCNPTPHHEAPRARSCAAAKGTHFHLEVKVYLVPHHAEYSDGERARTWFSPRDFDIIQGDVRRTVKAVRRADRNGTPLDDESVVCGRGLEQLRSAEHMEQRKVNRDCCLAAVYDEQRRQRQTGVADKERLRTASERGSEWSRKEAERLGRQDERDVEKIREEDKTKVAASIAHRYAALRLALDVNGGGNRAKEDDLAPDVREQYLTGRRQTSSCSDRDLLQSIETNFHRAMELLPSSSFESATATPAAASSSLPSDELRRTSIGDGSILAAAGAATSSSSSLSGGGCQRSRSFLPGRASGSRNSPLKRALSLLARETSSSSLQRSNGVSVDKENYHRCPALRQQQQQQEL